MARLTIEQKRGKFAMNVPHKLLIDGRFVGIMKDKRVSIEMPMGEYEITIQSMIPFISASQRVTMSLHGETNSLTARSGGICCLCWTWCCGL